jgi:hypothetical protein
VRLRFLVVLAVAFAVVGRWDALRNRWDRLVRAGVGGEAPGAVSADTEYFCPMDPGVVSDWPGKCGVCNMALVRRRKGEAAALPSGVVARMQVSPYRIQLAGVRTSPVGYEALERAAVLDGTVNGREGDRARVIAEATERELPLVDEGSPARVECEALGRREPLSGRVVKVDGASASGRWPVVIEVDDPGQALREGLTVSAGVARPVASMEPFQSLPSDPPPLAKGEARAVHVCPDHAEVVREKAGPCPVDGKAALEPSPLLANQRVRWWCPMHPKVTAERAGEKCAECGGMVLVPRVITYRPAGQVLSVPDSAVVDTGARTTVFVERMPGMFDGVEVVLGPRCGDRYPVVSGLEPGQRVVTAGAFLLDAETRLNPALASSYFGATRGGRAPTAAEPPPSWKALADAQKVCPVTGKPLGSMGAPVKVDVAGRAVLVCCEGCEGPLKADPAKYLRKLDAGRSP